MRVLLASDGSKGAAMAARWLAAFPLPPDARITVVTVTTVPQPPVAPDVLAGLRESLLAAARRVAEAARAILLPRWPATTALVAEGDPREEIPRLAEDEGADLVVLGARGLGGFRRLLLGSVSLAVARHAPCSVLVVKRRAGSLQSILLATDGSEHAGRAVRFLAALPVEASVRVRVFGVAERLRYPSTAPRAVRGPLQEAFDELRAERKVEMEGVVGRATAGLRGTFHTIETALVEGLPAEEILKMAAAPRADLVVVGARGIGHVKRLLLGSVSEKVLKHAPCPVLVVKGA